MWQGETFHLKCRTKSGGERGKGGKRKEKEEKKRKEKKRGVRSSNFSLEFMVIGPSVLIGARGKVGPLNESYAWVPKSVGFVKLQEVRVFLSLDLFLV